MYLCTRVCLVVFTPRHAQVIPCEVGVHCSSCCLSVFLPVWRVFWSLDSVRKLIPLLKAIVIQVRQRCQRHHEQRLAKSLPLNPKPLNPKPLNPSVSTHLNPQVKMGVVAMPEEQQKKLEAEVAPLQP